MVAEILDKNDQELTDLVQKAAQGDRAAFGQIYELYFEKVYRFIYWRVNHNQVAEDLVAETFIRAWNNLSEMQKVEAFAGWLYQIARNLVIDHYRSQRPTLDLNNLENLLEYEVNIVEQANLSLEQKKFLEVLSRLSPDQQLVIKLKFLDELDNREIAQILGKSEGAIRVIQHRAINQLKQLLNRHDQS